MTDSPQQVVTRFRAYQLGQAGASYSYFANKHFTLVEGMATEVNIGQVRREMENCSKETIDTLHITGWDNDHCSSSGLKYILDILRPTRIEYPGYPPHTDTARDCLKTIKAYQASRGRSGVRVTAQCMDPPYLKTLEAGKRLGYRNIVYHPKELRDASNDNSTVKLFREGSFNVASLGDVQDPAIAAMLRRCSIFNRETDILILAHHGADNGFTTRRFLKEVEPSVAICTSNYDNQFDHPRQEIRDMLYEQDIKIFTTKHGDVIIESIPPHTGRYKVVNLKANSTQISSVSEYEAKKRKMLSMNGDTLRNIYHPGFKGLR
jgi:competence protein ComEC